MSLSVGQIALDLKINQKGFNKEVKGIQSLAKKTGKMLAAAFTVRTLARFTAQCLELGSNLSEVQNVVDTVFPTMNEKLNEFAKNAASSYGLSETMAKKYAGSFGAMASSFGFAESKAYKMSTTLTGLAGDIASFYNISQDEAYTKLKSVFTGETEALKELGVVMTQSALDSYALANGFGKTTSAMSEMEKVSLRYAFVQSQLTNAAGDFAKTSDSWANQVRILSLQFDSLRASIGQGLINILTPVIKSLNLLMTKLVQAGDAFKRFTETLMGKQVDTTSATTNEIASIEATAASADSALNTARSSAAKLKRELAGFDKITKLSDNTDNTGAASSGSTSSVVNAAEYKEGNKEITKFSGNITKLSKSFDKLKKSAQPFFDLLSKAGKWTLDNVLKPLGKWTINELAPKVIEALAGAFDVLYQVGKLLQPVAIFLWDYFLKPMANFTGGLILTFLQALSNDLGRVAKVLEVFRNAVKDSVNASRADWEIFKASAANVGEKIVGVYEEMKAAILDFPNHIKDIKVKVSAWFTDKKEDLAAKWKELVSGVQDKAAYVYARIGNTWNDLKSTWNNLLANFKDKAVSITLSIKGTVSDIKKWFNESVIDAVNAKIHKIPLLKNVSIPYLAQGGYVKANTPQLAMIGDNRHQGEVVAPEKKLIEMARLAASSVGGTDAEVVILLREIVELIKALELVAKIDGGSLTDLVVKLINQRTKSTGVFPLNL